jgi:2,3-bisphosphoglycerate-dependent phosphoglycerate mutase
MKFLLKIALFLCPLTVFSQDFEPYKNNLPRILPDGTVKTADGKNLKIDGFQDKETTVFFIIRHSEKDTAGGTNADLNAIGRGRAVTFPKIFRKIHLAKIYSTDKPRTKNTARPIANAKKRPVDIYDAKQQKELLEKLVKDHKGDKILLVGHSNTVPQLVNILRGNEDEKEFSESDYSRLYIVTVKKIGDAQVHLIRF